MPIGPLPLIPSYTTQVSLLFQSPPKGPTIPYKPQQFSVPPPTSPNSPTLSCHSDSPMVTNMSSSTPYVSPPPQCPPPASLPMQIDSIQVLPPMFPPQPLPFPAMAPCLRYAPAPPHTMYSLALHPGHSEPGKQQGLHPQQVQFCPQVPEASRVSLALYSAGPPSLPNISSPSTSPPSSSPFTPTLISISVLNLQQ